MERTVWRVWVTEPAGAAWNMAVDEALLEGAEGGPTLRLYGWAPPAVSLGRFQPVEDAEVPQGYGLVRRLTGGAALVHRPDEVTYSVTAPYALFGSRKPVVAYEAVHEVIAAGLRGLGVPLQERGGRSECPVRRGLCYAAATRYDLVVGEEKLVGSAQARRGRGFLQHGAIPCTRETGVVGATSLGELMEEVPARGAIVEALVEALREGWAAEVVEGPPEGVEARAQALMEERYGAEEWTRER